MGYFEIFHRKLRNHLKNKDWLEASLLFMWSFDHAAAPPRALQQPLLIGNVEMQAPDVGPGLKSSGGHRDGWPIAGATVPASPETTTLPQNLLAGHLTQSQHSSNPDADFGFMHSGDTVILETAPPPAPNADQSHIHAVDPPRLVDPNRFVQCDKVETAHWACSRCTVVNERKRRKCIVCFAVDPTRPIKRHRAL